MPRRYDSADAKRRILTACVRFFLEKGYTRTTVAEIVKEADVSISTFQNVFRQKLPPVYVYAVETSIQLALTELNENLRDIYLEAYSHTEASEYIYQHTSSELYRIFGPYLPSYTESDFYELEIGSAGIMRGYMSRPCDKYFTLEKKLARFLSMSLNAYAVPAAEQKQVLDFIAKLDIRAIAVQVMQELFKALAMRFSFPLPDSVKA